MDKIRRISELTAPAVEPVSLEDLKAHLRISNSADDGWLTAAIKAARMAAEDYCGCIFIRRTFRQFQDQPGCPQDEWWDGVREAPISVLASAMVELMKRPLVSVEAVRAWDDADTSILVSPSVYYVDTTDQLQPGRLIVRRGQAWPVVMRVANGFQVDFTAGFSADVAGLPGELTLSVKMLASYLYSNRGDCTCDKAGAMGAISQSGAAFFLESYRLTRF